MIIGIVGSEEAKFTEMGKIAAKLYLRILINKPDVEEVVSGGCHLGGIDIWAAEIARELGKPVTEFKPRHLTWNGGYKERNLQIAERSDVVYCVTVDKLPDDFKGMKFEHCYHCNKDNHVKSGGCWTMKKAKVGRLVIVSNFVTSKEDHATSYL
jgi:hypothetical protein